LTRCQLIDVYNINYNLTNHYIFTHVEITGAIIVSQNRVESVGENLSLTKESSDNNGIAKMSSKNHGLIQARLAAVINVLDDYNVATELSLDVSDVNRQKILTKYGLTATRELKADVAIYRADEFDFADPDDEDESNNIDSLRVQEMPISTMEIVSPSQSSYEILQKCRAYLAMGVKTCWLIDPNLKTIIVYSGAIRNKKTYLAENNAEVEDAILNIKISIDKLFGKKTGSAKQVVL
jgi:Uma2 family endonuclease